MIAPMVHSKHYLTREKHERRYGVGGENESEQGESGEIGFDVSDDLAQKRIGGLEGVMMIVGLLSRY